MSRHALIKDGTVVNVIEVGFRYEVPEGHVVVPSEQAAIGDTYDGSAFARSFPPEYRDDMFAHATKRYFDVGSAMHRIGDVTVMVHVGDHQLLLRLAERAKASPAFQIEWPMGARHYGPVIGQVVVLNAQQIIALNEKITDYWITNLRAFAGVIKGIHSGAVKDHLDVDTPPHPLPQWPHRWLQEPK